MDSEYDPVPEPFASFVAPSAMVGVASVVEYTIPRSVTVSPPSDVTSPPRVAEVVFMLLAAVVVTVGAAEAALC